MVVFTIGLFVFDFMSTEGSTLTEGHLGELSGRTGPAPDGPGGAARGRLDGRVVPPGAVKTATCLRERRGGRVRNNERGTEPDPGVRAGPAGRSVDWPGRTEGYC